MPIQIHQHGLASCMHVEQSERWLIDIGKNVKITEGVTILTHGFDWSVLKGVYGDILGSSGGSKSETMFLSVCRRRF